MKIVIADKQSIFRAGIIFLLRRNIEYQVVAEVYEREDVLSTLEEHSPDILIIDYQYVAEFEMTDFSLLKESSPQTKILALTNNDKEEDILTILKYGISGYLLKDCEKEDILTAVVALGNGGKFYCTKVIDMLYSRHIGDTVSNGFERKLTELTPKEREIIKFIAQGKTTKEIADKLYISTHTVNTHRKNIAKKLNVKNSSELVLFAIKGGIVDTTEYYI